MSDYLKGRSRPRRVDARGAIAARARDDPALPLLVDPKIPHLDCYAGATLVTPNHHEAEPPRTGAIRTDEDAREAAREFRAARRLRRAC